MNQPLPTLTTTTVDGNRVLVDDQGRVAGPTVVLDSTNADSGSTPTYRFRAGNVIALRTSTGRYVECNDTNADTNSPASVSASETADNDWQSSTITCTVDGGVSVTVVLGATDNTDAEVVTALNADTDFIAAGLRADVNSSLVRIRTATGGAHKALHVTSDLATAFGAAGTFAAGASAKYLVTAHDAYLQDDQGTAINAPVATYWAGNFDESNLIVAGTKNVLATTCPAARAELARRGSDFN